MKIRIDTSYNIDLLCFLNTMTADDLFVEYHREDFDRFYPLLSDEIKKKIADLVSEKNSSLLSNQLTLFISSLKDFIDRNILQMLQSIDEIIDSMNKTPYLYDKADFEAFDRQANEVIIPLIVELEKAGIKEYWYRNCLPLIEKRREQLEDFVSQYNMQALIEQFRSSDKSDITVFLSIFTAPIGIKLVGYNLVSDISWSNDITLRTVAHEVFHPPYDSEKVKEALDIVSSIPWMIKAYENQPSHLAYSPMKGFIEENIVEALGVYVTKQLGIELDADEYFATHDEGSHKLSPHFYTYLCNNPKEPSRPFEEYFRSFVAWLKCQNF